MKKIDYCNRETYLRLRNIHKQMKRRCNNPHHPDYNNYGGRGIRICDAWTVFNNFAHWALANGYGDDLTIDRIDNDGDYYPENCRWVTIEAQSLNKRNTRTVLGRPIMTVLRERGFDGKKLYSMRRMIADRLDNGWDEELALNTPPHEQPSESRIRVNLVGQRFGRLVVLAHVNSKVEGTYEYKCKVQCDCGNVVEVRRGDLSIGRIKSCGCLNAESQYDKYADKETHRRIRKTLENIKSWCRNKNVRSYKLYGAKGIIVCDEWNDAHNFINWSLNNGYSDTKFLERVSDDGNFCPANCRWVDNKNKQSERRRSA